MEARARKATRQLPWHDDAINRKPEVGTQTVGATGSKLSFQTLAPSQDSGFLHTYKTHEELYIILKGEGEYRPTKIKLFFDEIPDPREQNDDFKAHLNYLQELSLFHNAKIVLKPWDIAEIDSHKHPIQLVPAEFREKKA